MAKSLNAVDKLLFLKESFLLFQQIDTYFSKDSELGAYWSILIRSLVMEMFNDDKPEIEFAPDQYQTIKSA